MNEMPPVDLNKCCECKKSFTKGQEYWELKDKHKNKVSMNSCLTCWDKWVTEQKKWKT
ncbi:hypothetical protein [endosymbiont GvMRE of Glomus versiforme]|uniref:hypothetical protein n=1 Tax=endosymbiont GvMRE of Glomus versiforme TaxID=2039283 RepID=UPI000EDE4969|nr:hypothetical protein [endosymbiont GvMRE of Glomus versiforme]RHZ35917.1 hypothetical protein GvMRE_Ic4g87 [endosymbiont GvMRE of Glomus versiforme]